MSIIGSVGQLIGIIMGLDFMPIIEPLMAAGMAIFAGIIQGYTMWTTIVAVVIESIVRYFNTFQIQAHYRG